MNPIVLNLFSGLSALRVMNGPTAVAPNSAISMFVASFHSDDDTDDFTSSDRSDAVAVIVLHNLLHMWK
jgi:hypothetical protein